MEQLPDNSVVMVFAAAVSVRNGDVEHAYRQDSYFYYLTGFVEPESVLLLRRLDNQIDSLLLCREKTHCRKHGMGGDLVWKLPLRHCS